MPSESTFAVADGLFLIGTGKQNLWMDPFQVKALTTPPNPSFAGSWLDQCTLVMFQGGAVVLDGIPVARMARALAWARSMAQANESGDMPDKLDTGEPPTLAL